MMEVERLPLQHIIDNPLNVQRNNRPAAFVGLKEEAVVGVVVGEIFRQGGVLPELVPGKPERCGPVQAIGKPVAGGLATGGVAGCDGRYLPRSLTFISSGVSSVGIGATFTLSNFESMLSSSSAIRLLARSQTFPA